MNKKFKIIGVFVIAIIIVIAIWKYFGRGWGIGIGIVIGLILWWSMTFTMGGPNGWEILFGSNNLPKQPAQHK